MFVRDHEWYFRHLAEHIHLKTSDVLIVPDLIEWCREHGVSETDVRKPLKLVAGNGSKTYMLIAEMIPDEILEERIRALRIRSQLGSVGYDRADLLNSDMKKIAYLFLKEYAATLRELADDEFASDAWIFEQMDQLGMFRP